jgi:hypothetical protein
VATIRGELNNILNSLKQDINSAREVYKELWLYGTSNNWTTAHR